MSVNYASLNFMPKIDYSEVEKKEITQAKDSNGDFYTSSEILYDENNNKLSNTLFDENNKIKNQTIYEYDENNKLIKEYEDIDGDKIQDLIYNYDYYNNGSLKTIEVDKNADGKIDQEESQYTSYLEIEYTEEEKKEMEKQKQEEFDKKPLHEKIIINLFNLFN